MSDKPAYWDVIKNDIPIQYPAVKKLADSLPIPATPDNLDEFV